MPIDVEEILNWDQTAVENFLVKVTKTLLHYSYFSNNNLFFCY